jgi:xanthine dehydrogenase YagT iron-sulfur-binding subunit
MERGPDKSKCGESELTEQRSDREDQPQSGITRRGFLASIGAGAAVAAAGVTLGAPAAGEAAEVEERTRVSLLINGRAHELLVEPRWSLLYVMREKLGITGPKPGCERGECGACTVLIDGRPRYACLTLALEAEGAEITTVEGLMTGEELGPVQQAFLEEDAFQCGYCTSGQIMAVEGLLRKNVSPSPDDIRLGVSGNLCRCGAYPNIFKAAGKAARRKAGKGGAS